MESTVVERLVTLNREFYQTFSASFSSTRGQVQPGVNYAAQYIPANGNILDIGCGNGNLMQVLKKNQFQGTYVGIDFSENLIAKCRHTYQSMESQATFQASFHVFDLVLSDWKAFPINMDWDVICAFAVFHHIPGREKRLEIFNHIHAMLGPDSQFMLSVWQPQNSQRLAKRFLDWEKIGLQETDVEEGDTLLDWKAEELCANKVGFRYVHIFNQGELEKLAAETGFSVRDGFYSDGKEGNIGFYQVWEKSGLSHQINSR